MRLSWSDRRFRGLVWQVLVVGSVAALAIWLWRNTVTNLDARHIATGFAFLGWSRLAWIALDPILDDVVIELFAPKHPRQRLPMDTFVFVA